jgi:hypothetical protein
LIGFGLSFSLNVHSIHFRKSTAASFLKKAQFWVVYRGFSMGGTSRKTKATDKSRFVRRPILEI